MASDISFHFVGKAAQAEQVSDTLYIVWIVVGVGFVISVLNTFFFFFCYCRDRHRREERMRGGEEVGEEVEEQGELLPPPPPAFLLPQTSFLPMRPVTRPPPLFQESPYDIPRTHQEDEYMTMSVMG